MVSFISLSSVSPSSVSDVSVVLVVRDDSDVDPEFAGDTLSAELDDIAAVSLRTGCGLGGNVNPGSDR